MAELSGLHLFLLAVAVFMACAFEFVNGFHDTANAVATVIYTRSLKPTFAVILSGIFNFLGVVIGGTAVAMGIVELLPIDLLSSHSLNTSLVMVFSLLTSAIAWNLGTWYLGLPASSSHALIGAILGIGLAHAHISNLPILDGVNVSKVKDIALALIISPLFGFLLSAVLLFVAKKLFTNQVFHGAPPRDKAPPWIVRTLLILTSSGVSFSHGSNDGQKGMGLIMLILIAVLPARFALSPNINISETQEIIKNTELILKENFRGALLNLNKPMKESPRAFSLIHVAEAREAGMSSSTAQETIRTKPKEFKISNSATDDKFELRTQILKLSQTISKIEKQNPEVTSSPLWSKVTDNNKKLKATTRFVPVWVVLMVALSIGLGTMIGWKRIVVTIGERIGKSHLTYAQGASAELVAMSTIGLSAVAGLPVSTTHVLSSGIAGTMIASKSSLQGKTVKNILLAWILTVPVCVTLSFTIFVTLFRLVG
ncbi:MAG: hypothetical protein A4S09_10825 [Proteobacteria bacterium SG_bin7]|nr:MAG: hypothetical protein A4S09_10825 [Proteobacteria bacterium SG_bin7]